MTEIGFNCKKCRPLFLKIARHASGKRLRFGEKYEIDITNFRKKPEMTGVSEKPNG